MAVPLTTLDQAQTALANLLFQSNVPQGEQALRAFYITAAVQRLYRSFDYEMAHQSTSLTTDDSGIADISDLLLGPIPAINFISDGIRDYGFIFASQATDLPQGAFKYWLVINEDGDYELHTSEPNTNLTLDFFQAPDISTQQAVTFTPMVIAKGALIYYRQAQDQDADTSVEEDAFRQEVSEVSDAQNRRAPQRFAQSPRDRYGTYLGRT